MPKGIYKHKTQQGFQKGHKFGNRFQVENKIALGNKLSLVIELEKIYETIN